MTAIVDNCSFLPCDQVDECSLVGGCVLKRFGTNTASAAPELKKGAPAIIEPRQGRPNRDPSKIQRQRKALR